MKNLVFNLRTAKAQAEGCATVTKSSRMAKILTTLTLLLTLCVGQMWADNGDFYNASMSYKFGDADWAWIQDSDNGTGMSRDLGTLSSGTFKVGDVYLLCWDDWGANFKSSGGQMCYTNKGSGTQYLTGFTRSDKDGNNYNYHKTGADLTIASATDASGSYSLVCWYQTWGWGDRFFPKSSGNYTLNYNIAPPAVSGFGVSASGFLAGSGTSGDPYLVKSGNSLTFTVSGSQAHSDANSTFKYWLNPGTKKTSGTLSTGSITSTSPQSAVVHGQCINNSSSSLVGTESTSTINYKAVSVKDISVYIYVGGRTSAEINSVEMNGCTPYVGTKALAAVKINNQSAGAPKFTKSGNWLYYTFTNVTKVSNITCAREGGNIFTGEITDNVYYTYEGASLPGQCIQPANPTWGTAPASAALGAGTMTATVSGAPAGAKTTWTSSNTTAIEVSNTGVITYKAVGSATITARVTWAATGDYCAGSYDLTQTINCTSGATVSVERTCAAYVAAGVAGQVSARITFTGTSSGWKYRIKQGWSTGYETAWLDASGTSADWTMTGGMDAVERTYTVELYTTEGAATPVSTANFSVTGETAYETTITAADANGSVSPSGTVYANNNHVHPSITATPNSHYQFKNWTSNNAAASVADDDAEETTVTATAAGYTITANFAGDQYTITYKDQGDVTYSGNNEGSLPTTHTYGTATALVNGTKAGYTFGGWYTDASCTSSAGSSIGATAKTSDFTLYAKWTAKTYDITYVDANNVATIAANPSTGSTDATINFTVTMKPGFKSLSVTAVDAGRNTVTVTNPSSNNYRFTMPASAVTVTVTATALPIVYVLKTKHANSSLGDDATGFPSTGQIWAWKAGGSENFYNGATWEGPSASSKATAITDDIIGDEWYRFIPDNISQFDGSTAYHVILTSTNQILNTQTTFIENGSSHSAATHTGTIWIVPHGTDANTAYLYTSYPDEIVTPYNTTYYAGDHGSINVFGTTITSGNSQTIATTKNRTLTATPASGYEFNRWITTGSVTVADATSATTTVSATGAGGTVTATYFETVNSGWYIKGNPAGNDWGTPTSLPLNRVLPGETNVYYRPVTLPANDQYFRFWCSNGGNHQYGASSNNLAVSKDTKYNLTYDGDKAFKYSAGGTVWFVVDASGDTKKCWLQDPVEFYSVNFGYSDGCKTFSAKDGEGNDLVSGNTYVSGTELTFTQTKKDGYTFVGWNTAADGSGSSLGTGSSYTVASLSADVNVYAIYEPKTTNITLDQTGAATSGSVTTRTGTYDAEMPSISGANTLPVAPQGYAFMGYYDALEPLGTQYYNADGTSAHIWDKVAAETTLYAYYKKSEITAVVLNHDIFEPVAEATGVDDKDYVFANPTIAPRPTPTTKLCWELRYSNDNPVAGDDYRAILVSGDQVKFKLVGLAAGGYKIHVELRTGSECGAGTLLSSYDKSFSIASKHIVTIQYKSGDFTLKASTNVDGKPLAWSEVIEAASITGYTFNHWEAGEGVTIKDDEGEDKTTSTDATIQIKAIYDSKLTALYTKKNMIYFYNTLGWDTVFVYFYENGNYWSDTYGTGANQYQNWGGQNPYWFGEHGGMKRVAPGSDIWYFDYTEAGYETRANVVFADKDQSKQVDCAGDNACIFFSDNAKVARRSDHNSSLPMFVPLSNQTGVNKNENRAKYYSDGYWMNYPENTGYTLKLYSSQDATTPTRTIRFPFSADTKMPLKLDVELNEAATNYYYTIYREDGQVLSASYGMNKNHHTNVRLNSPSTKISIKTTAPGIYKYSLVYMNNSGTKDYYISVDYPIVENDYRISYSDNATWSQGSAHTSGWYHPSDVIRKNTDAEVTQYDTVSFYISKGAGITASMKFQYAKTIVEAGTITWQDVTGGGINAADTISKAGVYNFIIKQEGTAKPVVEKVEPYTGNYYIRTDGAGSTKWDYYRSSDHQMTYTEFSMSAANSFGDKYSHYFMHWSPGGTNIKFVVANDYSPCISDTLENDLHDWGNLNAGGQLKKDGNKSETEDIYSANVRFMYNYKTNKISRAYVASSTNLSRLFLVLRGNEEVRDENGTAVNDQEVTNGAILSDKENWIYERILQIKPDSRFKLFACYAEADPTQSGAQYFRGAYDSDNFTTNANSVILISGTGGYQKARVLYDFKTNRLVCAWLPSDEPIDETLNIDADVMVIRDHQEAAECITFSRDGELKKVKTVYGAMKFNRWTLNNRYRGKGGVEDNNKDHCATSAAIAEYHGILPAGEQKSVYERSLYFISFPFDVKVSEIFGFGTYGKHWVLEYYDGLNRAKNGYWIDSPANWKYVTPSMAKTYELKAYEGYILCLSLGRMAYDNTEVWPNNISNVELYFPSKTPMTTIASLNVNISGLNEIAGDPYRCTINREGEDGDRRVKDSYWRCLGVPSYDMYAGTLTSDGSTVINWQTDYSTFPFLYAWNMNDNTLTPQSTNRFSFKPMHAYLTQIGTAIYWTNVSATPAVMARQTEEPTEYNWCLTLNAGEQMIDQTYVRMSTDEVITNEFDFGQDLSKELNTGRSDIYSFIGYERAAANSMQMNTETTTIVPLGLNIEATGEYTFSIPDGTNGIGITLIDEETGIRTSLSALDYTVELAAGDYTERFWLEISPVKGAETGIDPGVDARENGVRKVMIDGILYIVRDGKMYDATGKRVE